jgi:propionyl-CoA carboxylase beta chain
LEAVGNGASGKTISEPDKSTAEQEREAVRKKKIEEFRDRFASPYVAADRGFVDAIIQPHETRKKLIQALAMLETKRDKNPPKKHGNIPL